MRTRIHNLPVLAPVSEFTVAEHRYRWDAPSDPAELDRTTWKQVRDASPYKAGEVVYVVYGDTYAKAYIHEVSCERNYYDELREYYIVRRETKAGRWANQTYKAHPGYVQRGYQRAGLAPEMPASA